MATVAVVFNGSRVNPADVYTNWGSYGGSGAGGAAEAPIAYQNALACNRKQTTTGGALGGIDYDPGSGAVDMTAAANKLWFCKVIISDSFDCNTSEGLRVTIGSASTATYKYNLAGSTATLSRYSQYPAQGGYILTAIDPNIAAWPITTTGTIDQTAIDYFGVQGSWITGQAKAENIAMDAIDIGTGLTLTAGDGVSTDGNYTDFVATDQDITTNRWGVVRGSGDAVFACGLLTIGSATATEFTDSTSVVTFDDGYHSRGLVGVAVALSNASTIINDGCLLIGEGTRNGVDANDTRPDYTVTGTTATSADFSHTLRNFRDVTYTSACDVDGADIEAHLLVQATAHIQNSIIKTNALTSVACLQDPTFGTVSGLHDCTFIQTGAGHAIEIDATGTYDFNNLFFSGYGADASDSAAIDVTTTAAVTINVNGGDTPTFKTAGTGNVTIVSGAVTVQAKAALKDGTAVENARVFLKASDGTGPFPFEDTVTITRSTTTATVSHTAHGMATNDKIYLEGITDKTEDNWRVITITYIDADSYSFTTTDSGSTSYLGTIKATFVALNGLTNASGILSTSRVYTTDQPVTGWTRKATSSPFLQEGVLVGSVDSADGFSGTAVMLADE